MKVVYSDDALDIDERPSFNFHSFFDFFALGDSIFIASKPRFESVRSYRAGHAEAFGDLAGEEEFAVIFADLDPILVRGEQQDSSAPRNRDPREGSL